jgi:hypothetical protein
MARSSRRTLFLVVVVLITCGFLGMVFGQKINPAAAPGGALSGGCIGLMVRSPSTSASNTKPTRRYAQSEF